MDLMNIFIYTHITRSFIHLRSFDVYIKCCLLNVINIASYTCLTIYPSSSLVFLPHIFLSQHQPPTYLISSTSLCNSLSLPICLYFILTFTGLCRIYSSFSPSSNPHHIIRYHGKFFCKSKITN